MTEIVLTKDNTGTIVGYSEADKRAYRRIRNKIKACETGELFHFDYWFPRNLRLHRKHFALLKAVFESQEIFSDMHTFRGWVQVGAGHCEFVPGPDGMLIAIPKSIAYRKMDDEEFSAHHTMVKDFLRSDHATETLWPHLDDVNRLEMIEILVDPFEEQW